MKPEFFRFKVGDFDCTALLDGIVEYHNPALTFFGNAPAKDLDSFLKINEVESSRWSVYPSPYTCLHVSTAKEQILIDTGAGNLTPSTGNLPMTLLAAGIDPQEISQVILTHGHPDHIGGIMCGSQPAFPNARYLMARNEWDFWFSEDIFSQLVVEPLWKNIFLDFVNRQLLPLKNAIHLIEGNYEVCPGIQVIPCPGHTPGLLSARIESQSDILYDISDLVLHPLNLGKLAWGPVFDQDVRQAVITRETILRRIKDEGAKVLGFHFPYPGIGKLSSWQDGYRWEPN